MAGKINIPTEAAFVTILVIVYFAAKFGGNSESIELLLTLIVCLGAVAAASFAVYFCIKTYLKRKNNLSIKKTFKDMPWLYDHKTIKITGRIEKIFTTPLSNKIIFGLRHQYRVLISSHDHQGRYEHQRFLISSPQIQLGSCIFVSHNTHFGKIQLNENDWVEVQGEYLHRTTKRKSFFGPKFTYYGLIHKTHDPNFINILSDKPNVKELGNVAVIHNV
jgi:hypothetical protein